MPELAPQGFQLDPDEVTAVQIAVRNLVNTFTYAGMNVGKYVSDQELAQVASVAVAAAAQYRNAKSI
jgi:hypothetical protein